MKRHIYSLIAFALCQLISPCAQGTSYARFVWDELILNSDFVGIVECETAGNEVSQERIVKKPTTNKPWDSTFDVSTFWGQVKLHDPWLAEMDRLKID